MIDFLATHVYLVIIGFFAAFIASYKLRQRLDAEYNDYDPEDVNPGSFKVIKAVCTVLPFAVLIIIMFVLGL